MWQPAYPDDLDDLDAEPLDDDDYDGDEGDEDIEQGPARNGQGAAGRAARAVPYLATAAGAATGYGANWAVTFAAEHGWHDLSGTVALGTCAATAAALPVLRFRLRNRRRPAAGIESAHVAPGGMSLEARRLFWRAGGFLTVWADAMALGATNLVGPDGMTAILLGGSAWLFRRWLRDHELELPTDTPAPPLTAAEPVLAIEPPPRPVRFPAPPPPDEGDLIAEKWAARVASGENPIAPGSTLGDDRVDLPHGYQWIVQLDPDVDNMTATQLRQRCEDVAFRFGLRRTHVIIEPLKGDDEREDRALLTVITRDILKGTVPYPGPRYLPDGRIPHGLWSDGSGTPYWRTKDEKGPVGGLVVGGSGSGKSELLARLGMAMRKSGEWIVLFGDGDEQGRSAPLLKRIAYDFAKGAAEVLAQLEALEAWFHVRGKTMGRYTIGPDGTPIPITDPDQQDPAGKLMPCRRLNGWVWILDEFYLLTRALGREFVQRVSDLRRAMRKRGGTIIVGTQSGTVGDFAGDDVLQGQLMQDNVVLLRTMNDVEQYAIPGDFGCDPTTLPDGGGYGFGNDPDGPKQMFRGEYDKHMSRWVRDLPEYQPDLPSARVYAYKRPPTPADPVADYEEAVRDEADILARIDAGQPLPWEEQPEPEPEPTTFAVGGDGVAAPANTAQWAGWTVGGVHVEEPQLGPMFTGVEAGDPPPAPRRPLNGSEQTVLAQLAGADGPLRNQVIIGNTSLSESVASKALRELTDRGYALRHGQGLHEITALGREAVQAVPSTSTVEAVS